MLLMFFSHNDACIMLDVRRSNCRRKDLLTDGNIVFTDKVEQADMAQISAMASSLFTG